MFKSSRNRRRGGVYRSAGALLLSLAVSLAFISSGLTGSSSTTLPNGADLTVSIDDPLTSTEFLIAEGESTRDIDVSGTASIGLGEPRGVLAYVLDVSFSTSQSGGACGTIMQCQQQFFVGLNDAAIASGSIAEVGVAIYGQNSATADMSPDAGDQILTHPDAGPGHVNTVINSTTFNGTVEQFTLKSVGSGATNFAAGLTATKTILDATTVSGAVKSAIFASDGLSNIGGAQFAGALDALAADDVVVNTIAIGQGSSCTGGTAGTLQQIADATGGTCFHVVDPDDLPDLIEDLVGARLTAVDISVNGGTPSAIPAGDLDKALPLIAADMLNYTTTVAGLGAGDHEICVTATGEDARGNTGSTTHCETIHLYEFTLVPATETNELGQDNEHTVVATLVGDHDLAGRDVAFVVGGQNAGATGTCDPVDCTTDASGQVTFTYSVPVAPSSLGTDTITASITLNDPLGETATREVTKEWVDTTPPVAMCVETVNPSGQNIPRAPAQGGQGQNQDGFYELLAEDDVWPAEELEIFVVDTGSGEVFGPFAVGTKIKYIQAPGAEPSISPMGGNNAGGQGQANAVDWQIKGQGDAQVYAVDGSGNVSDPVDCLVPPPPQ